MRAHLDSQLGCLAAPTSIVAENMRASIQERVDHTAESCIGGNSAATQHAHTAHTTTNDVRSEIETKGTGSQPRQAPMEPLPEQHQQHLPPQGLYQHNTCETGVAARTEHAPFSHAHTQMHTPERVSPCCCSLSNSRLNSATAVLRTPTSWRARRNQARALP